jgi:hypothetical protein
MEVYARASDSADREAANLLQERYAEVFDDQQVSTPQGRRVQAGRQTITDL